jgi:PPOX class probable F420-dependent enzyme
MFSDAARELLDLPAFAKLALRLPGGGLQNTVMWYRHDGGTLRMIAPAASKKARSLLRDPAVAVAVDHPDNGYYYLEVRGHAEVVQDDAAARQELRQIARRYIGDQAEAYVTSLSADPRVLIVIHPERARLNAGRRPNPAG